MVKADDYVDVSVQQDSLTQRKRRLATVGMIAFTAGLLIIAFTVSGWAAIGVFLVGLGVTTNICSGIIELEDRIAIRSSK